VPAALRSAGTICAFASSSALDPPFEHPPGVRPVRGAARGSVSERRAIDFKGARYFRCALQLRITGIRKRPCNSERARFSRRNCNAWILN
jgi:hypothetical protein